MQSKSFVSVLFVNVYTAAAAAHSVVVCLVIHVVIYSFLLFEGLEVGLELDYDLEQKLISHCIISGCIYIY